MKSGNYHRKHLRAPYKEEILFEDDDFVFKSKALNISEGGILLDFLPHFPSKTDVPLMLGVPQVPILRNFELEKLQSFSKELFPQKVIRLKCQMVRKETPTTNVDDVFTSRIGAKFNDLDQKDKKLLADYVDRFSTNLIYMQILLDSLQSEPSLLPKLRQMSDILGYDSKAKVAQIRHDVNHDYKSLQWL